jgi:hypothetical protein
MVFNATFNNISVYIVGVSFIDGGNRRTRRKTPTCRKSLTYFIKITYKLSRLYSPGINCTSNFVNILPVKYLYERRTTNERDKSTVLSALVRIYERGVCGCRLKSHNILYERGSNNPASTKEK